MQEQLIQIQITTTSALHVGSKDLSAVSDDLLRRDAHGKLLIPGLVDLYVHLREPGGSQQETIATGTQAAAAGGVTSVVCMADTMSSRR